MAQRRIQKKARRNKTEKGPEKKSRDRARGKDQDKGLEQNPDKRPRDDTKKKKQWEKGRHRIHRCIGVWS